MDTSATLLVFGATGRTGRHFTALALQRGHRVRALARTPDRLDLRNPELDVHQGSITDALDPDRLLDGVDAVVLMLGDARSQRTRRINTALVTMLVPAMRRNAVTRMVYQAGGLSAPPGQRLSPALRAVRATLARGYTGQHEDNEAVMRYLAEEAMDIDWVVHRASIGSDGPSKGVLERSASAMSIATFQDCASYTYRLLSDTTATHTCNPSSYREVAGGG